MSVVWYAAYGSNMSRARFDHYLRGGTPAGAKHAYPGCRDPAEPMDDRPWEIEPDLVFGGTSRTWGGGVASVDPDARGLAKARLYLVTLEQFADVLAQENWLAPGSVVLDHMGLIERDLGEGHTYGLVLALGSLDAHPILTFSQRRGMATAAPSARYLKHIALGLREAHSMTDDEIVGYLAPKRGIAGALSNVELLSVVGSP